MYKNKIAFIVEGSKTEPLIVKRLRKCIFSNHNIEIITLSYSFNIYNLWMTLKEYDFDADLIDLINEKNKNDKIYKQKFGTLKKDEFSEIYLFFDYDGHQNELPNIHNGDEVIAEMLDTFDNETELGKLIISYPMVEAIRDYSETLGICHRCTVDGYVNVKYKKQTKDLKKYQNINKFTEDDWNDLIMIFLNRCHCLLGYSSMYDYVDNETSPKPKLIFQNQLEKFLKPHKKVMVLSAFAEFLVEYYGRYLFNDKKELVFIELCSK